MNTLKDMLINDFMLCANPSITYFKPVYRRYTNFCYEYPNNKINRCDIKPKPIVLNITDVCAICLEELMEKDTLYETICSHFFHDKCIREYVNHLNKRTFNCPKCRSINQISI